jgi:hypothetical protein
LSACGRESRAMQPPLKARSAGENFLIAGVGPCPASGSVRRRSLQLKLPYCLQFLE